MTGRRRGAGDGPTGPTGPSFRRLMEVVDAALDRPPAARDAFLENACGDDDTLLRRARSLLASAEGPDAAEVDRRLSAAVGAAALDATGPSIPDRIGPYRVLRVLGEGGMGTVYAAMQEEPVRREVAIKVIRPGTHAPELIARFRAERQMLATLRHPNIAKLHDAGTGEDGLPYFVMEWIDGDPITTYCERQQLDVTARIQLFRKLLDAVQHAHQKTLVHRDLKPSNVLVAEVDDRPVLKVIDFGVARVATGDAGLTGPSGPGYGVGTLEYMSPECLLRRGHPADTRSDIYSLGVLLYELVAGRHPFGRDRFRGATPSEIERMLLEEPVPRATRERARRLRGEGGDAPRSRMRRSKQIHPDLDRIIETAMAREPSERYATVAELDADLGRLLEARPIAARPARWGYRAGRFITRNRGPVAATGLSLVVLLTMALLFTLRLTEERNRAEREAATAREVAGMLQSVFEVSDPAAGVPADLTARELLDRASERLEREIPDQPELLGALLAVLGRTYGGLGLWDEAERHLERAIGLAGDDDAGRRDRAGAAAAAARPARRGAGLRGRIFAGFAAILVLALGVALFASYNVSRLTDEFGTYAEVVAESERAQAINLALVELSLGARDALATGDEEALAGIAARQAALEAEIREALEATTEPQRRALVESIAERFAAFGEGLDRLFADSAALERVVGEVIDPAVESAIGVMNMAVYSASIDGDTNTANGLAIAMKDMLTAQVALGRYLSGAVDDPQFATTSIDLALDRASGLFSGLTHAGRKAQFTADHLHFRLLRLIEVLAG